MTGYLVNHQKKLKVFEKREEELRHAIRHDLSPERTGRAAERLREAKFAIFKSKFSQHSVLPANRFSIEKAAEDKPAVRKWVEMTTEEIIEKYAAAAGTLDSTLGQE